MPDLTPRPCPGGGCRAKVVIAPIQGLPWPAILEPNATADGCWEINPQGVARHVKHDQASTGWPRHAPHFPHCANAHAAAAAVGAM